MEYKYEMVKVDDFWPIKIIIHTTDKQGYIPRHWHESIEISYVLSGMIDEIYIDGKVYASGQSDIVLINSNAIHSFSVNRGENRKAITILMPYEFIKAIYPDLDQIAFDCISIGENDLQKKIHFDELREILDLIITFYENKENNNLTHIKVTSLSYELVYNLLKNFKVMKNGNSRIKARKYLERLTMITNYIRENYNQNLSLDFLSTKFNLSSEYLSRFFFKYTGMTLLQYINAIRLEKSYPDLMNTDDPITQIALNHGFPNEKSYNRVFKAVYLVTPSQYRKEQKKSGIDHKQADKRQDILYRFP
ncbi:AraC family transcriptional regulator [Paenibacillus sp. LHD-117]|uniref:AraC family transcriptional regulator n=1 Tax=Paenibacillus sp. LHD-117 TaxID=3071412 RepID=UPI0027E0D1C8|nr:AraC family transcriptional regulator [Paenibacillus sp. LHD-117]MDQ6421626.1 AraC family transcriptional regulator [Paenibacillus sp. LHD-117]